MIVATWYVGRKAPGDVTHPIDHGTDHPDFVKQSETEVYVRYESTLAAMYRRSPGAPVWTKWVIDTVRPFHSEDGAIDLAKRRTRVGSLQREIWSSFEWPERELR